MQINTPLRSYGFACTVVSNRVKSMLTRGDNSDTQLITYSLLSKSLCFHKSSYHIKRFVKPFCHWLPLQNVFSNKQAGKRRKQNKNIVSNNSKTTKKHKVRCLIYTSSKSFFNYKLIELLFAILLNNCP